MPTFLLGLILVAATYASYNSLYREKDGGFRMGALGLGNGPNKGPRMSPDDASKPEDPRVYFDIELGNQTAGR